MSELRSNGLVADTPIHANLINAYEKAGNFRGVSVLVPYSPEQYGFSSSCCLLHHR